MAGSALAKDMPVGPNGSKVVTMLLATSPATWSRLCVSWTEESEREDSERAGQWGWSLSHLGVLAVAGDADTERAHDRHQHPAVDRRVCVLGADAAGRDQHQAAAPAAAAASIAA